MTPMKPIKKIILITLGTLMALPIAASAFAESDSPRAQRDGKRSGFETLDKDGNGELSLEEFKASGRTPLGRMDNNKDGAVTQEEFLARQEKGLARAAKKMERRRANMEKRMEKSRKRTEEARKKIAEGESRAQKKFTELDLNGDGTIDGSEMGTMQDKRFAELDRDGNGSLSKREVRAGATKNSKRNGKRKGKRQNRHKGKGRNKGIR